MNHCDIVELLVKKYKPDIENANEVSDDVHNNNNIHDNLYLF